MRIISLLPSATEIIYNIGLQDKLAGRSHECDYPPEVENIPACSSPGEDQVSAKNFRDAGPGELIESVLSPHHVDAEKIKSLEPTHIITQSMCDKCAVTPRQLNDALEDFLQKSGVKIIDLNTIDLNSVYGSIYKLSSELGAETAGRRLVSDMQSEFYKIAGLAGRTDNKPRTAVIEWIDPLMAAGHWTAEMVSIAGAEDAFAGKNAQWLVTDALKKADPEIIIFAPCAYTINDTLKEIHKLTDQDFWHDLTAVKKENVFIADGSAYFNRPGPRLADTLRIMAEIIHPGIFEKSFSEKDYVQFKS